MLVLSAPSGAGKTTIAKSLAQRDSCIHISVSVTTRSPRPGEVAGRDYHFVSYPEYQQLVASGDFLEHAEVFGQYYGTPKQPVFTVLARGHDVLFDIDWQGARQLTQAAPADVVKVFILPPSAYELEKRLSDRKQDSPAVIAQRMTQAVDEMSYWPEYDYVIVNHILEDSVGQVEAIVTAERSRRTRQKGVEDFVCAFKNVADRP
jgi:guanylate kinase